MRAILILGLVMLLGACSSTPRNSSNYSYSNTYVAPTKPQYQAQTYKLQLIGRKPTQQRQTIPIVRKDRPKKYHLFHPKQQFLISSA